MSRRERRVCVVDDDLDIRESLRFLFEDAGYDVEEAADGQVALALLRAEPRPRVVLLDRMMARLDGVDTLRALVQAPALARRSAVVFMTARNDPPAADAARLLADHAFAVVAKPFDLDDLLSTVDGAWRRLAADPTASPERGDRR